MSIALSALAGEQPGIDDVPGAMAQNVEPAYTPPTPAPPPSPTFLLRELHFSESVLLGKADLDAIAKRYVGRELGLRDLQEIGLHEGRGAGARCVEFRREGFGDYTSSKYTRVRGHNLGLYPDENPWVLEDVDCVVGEGMVLIAHPNTYLPLSGYMVSPKTIYPDNGR
jgi:hypothetical protein